MGLPRRIVLMLVVALWGDLTGCGRTAELTLTLDRPRDPDPFFGVAQLQLVAIADGERVDLGRWRWDRGPIGLDQAIAPTFERLGILGLDAQGRVVASGVSAAIDVVRDPPDGPVPIYFSEVGVLSRTDVDLGPRTGGFSAALSDAVVFGGGLDADGCARRELVELSSRLVPIVRTELDLGRVDPRRSGGGVAPALLTEGATADGCSPPVQATDVWLLGGEPLSVRSVAWPSAFPLGAAVTAVAGEAFVLGGGRGLTTARTEVWLLDPGANPPRVSTIGQLDRPRDQAAAVPLTLDRVLFIGGRATTSTRTMLDDAAAFDTSSGRAVQTSKLFDQGRSGLAAVKLASGAIVVAGGDTAGGPSSFLGAVSVEPDGSGQVSMARSWGELAQPGPGRLLDLQDGSLLFVPDDSTSDLTWIGTLPRAVRVIPRPHPDRGPLIGDVLHPGLAILAAEDGTVWTFNSGAGGVFTKTAPQIAPDDAFTTGLVPSDPAAATFEEGSLIVEGPGEFSLDVLPEELVVLSPHSVTDFELTVTYRNLTEISRPSIVYGFADGDYDHLILEASPRVVRSPLRRGGGRVECEPLFRPELAAVGPHQIRLRRSGGGRRLALDLGADGTEELICNTPIPRSGAIALGVVSGRVAFDGVRLRAR